MMHPYPKIHRQPTAIPSSKRNLTKYNVSIIKYSSYNDVSLISIQEKETTKIVGYGVYFNDDNKYTHYDFSDYLVALQYFGSLVFSNVEANAYKLRVWAKYQYKNVEIVNQFYPVDTVEEAKDIINRLANEQVNDNHIIWNMFGLECYETDLYNDSIGGEWMEYQNDKGYNIDEIMDEEK